MRSSRCGRGAQRARIVLLAAEGRVEHRDRRPGVVRRAHRMNCASCPRPRASDFRNQRRFAPQITYDSNAIHHGARINSLNRFPLVFPRLPASCHQHAHENAQASRSRLRRLAGGIARRIGRAATSWCGRRAVAAVPGPQAGVLVFRHRNHACEGPECPSFSVPPPKDVGSRPDLGTQQEPRTANSWQPPEAGWAWSDEGRQSGSLSTSRGWT